jgi:hypothetical protein
LGIVLLLYSLRSSPSHPCRIGLTREDAVGCAAAELGRGVDRVEVGRVGVLAMVSPSRRKSVGVARQRRGYMTLNSISRTNERRPGASIGETRPACGRAEPTSTAVCATGRSVAARADDHRTQSPPG